MDESSDSGFIGLAATLQVAVVAVRALAGSVLTEGAFGSVLNVWSEPTLVPAPLVAEILKW